MVACVEQICLNRPGVPLKASIMPFQTTGKYDLVICDIDGCLSPESHAPINGPALSEIAEHNRQAIQNRDRPVSP